MQGGGAAHGLEVDGHEVSNSLEEQGRKERQNEACCGSTIREEARGYAGLLADGRSLVDMEKRPAKEAEDKGDDDVKGAPGEPGTTEDKA